MGDLLIMSKKELQRKSIFDLVKLGQITRLDASKRLYLSYRQTKRAYQRYLKEGDAGLTHRGRGKASPRAFLLNRCLMTGLFDLILSYYKYKNQEVYV